MAQDFLDELRELALGSRLKRMSELMMADAASVYGHFGIDVQPKWFTLLALLAKKGATGVVEAAESLGLSQPAISQFSNQLVKMSYISIQADERDSRRKKMALTPLGKQKIQQMQPMWTAVQKAAEELCSEMENDFYTSLKKLEESFSRRSLKQRTLDNYHE